MNKISIGIVVAVVLVAAGVLYYTKGNGGMMGSRSDEAQSIKDLIAAGINQKCVFTEPQSKTSGTIYIADGKMRGDFSSQSAAGTMSGHMIGDGTTVHTWMDGMSQGFTTSFTATESSATGTQQGLDPNLKTKYDCSRWSPDATLFELPAGVKFVDMNAMMQGGAGNRGTMNAPSKSAQCNACDMAPEPQRTQCRQALNCR